MQFDPFPGPAPDDDQGYVLSRLGPLAGRRVLDIGCGKGRLAKALAEAGAVVTGVDPAPEALTDARRTVPGASFDVGAAEALPFADRSFNAAVFLNSLHHVPSPSMERALDEARRVVSPGGFVVVVEPLADGSFNEVLKLINDETEVRACAQRALDAAARSDAFAHVEALTFVRREHFSGLDAFLVRAISADPASRSAVVARKRAEIADAFRRCATPDGDTGFWLDQPLKADLFATR